MPEDFRPVELFHIGPPKTATTWVYRCLKAHPGILTSPRDSIHYFDMHYPRGRAWYAAQFAQGSDGQKLFDPTYSYIMSELAPGRIQAENPRARIMFTLRHPIERAFSHYWHARKTGLIRFAFEDILKVHDCFHTWLEFGLPGRRIEEWLSLFPRPQILPIIFDDLGRDPEGTFRAIAAFSGIDEAFTPPGLREKVNVAGPRRNLPQRAAYRLGRALGMQDRPLFVALSGQSEYVQGVPDDLYNALMDRCLPEIERLEKLLDLDLSSWKNSRGGMA